jgi:predicted dehydrogenase
VSSQGVPEPLRLAFLGCGYITRVHSRHLRRLRGSITPSYASREKSKAEDYRKEFDGRTAFGSYADAIADPAIDAVVIAVPPRLHLDLTLQALESGKHVLVEKPAFITIEDYRTVVEARDRAGRCVLVGENDHYKPLAVTLRRLLAEGVIGDLVFVHLSTIAKKLKRHDDWRNDASLAGGDAFFEEGIHWLHLAGSLGPKITRIAGFRPSGGGTISGDTRPKSMLVSFEYDSGAVGSLYYSREIPSLLQGLRLSKLFGRDGIITFESNGGFVFAHGHGTPRLLFPGFRDIRGYEAMYRDLIGAISSHRSPEMSVERAMEDQRLMDQL